LHVAAVAALQIASELGDNDVNKSSLSTWLSEAFDAQTQAFRKFLEVFRAEGSWLVPALMSLVHDTRVLAVWADSVRGDGRQECLRETKTLLETCFRLTTMGRATSSEAQKKRSVGLYIVNHQFKVFFALKSLQLCRNLVRSVEMPTFPELDSFPLDQRVMYQFYRGRLLILDDRVAEARRALQFALDNCPTALRHNRKLILEFLVPISLFCGRAPTQNLLREYGIDYLADLMTHVQNGNVRALTKLIDDQQDHFIARGLFLTLDQLKVLAYRNLFRNVILIYQDSAADRAKTRVPLDILMRPFELYSEPDPLAQFADADGDDSTAVSQEELMEHIKCVLSNLIFQRYVKGYISHEKATLVLSPKEPFPKLNTIHPLEEA